MKKLSYLLMLFSALVLISCSEDDPIDPPTASFSFDIEGKTVTFNNASTGADSYSWDFGDGSTSTEMNPTHEYSDYGSYMAKLTATNNGGSDSRSIEVSLISAFQESWNVQSTIQTTTSDFTAAGGTAIVTDTQLNDLQANFVLTYVLGEVISANTNALEILLGQDGEVKLDDIATDKSSWAEVGGELVINSTVGVVANNANSITGVMNNDGTVTLTIGSLGTLSAWPAEFHIPDQPGQPGSGVFITSVTTVDTIVVTLSNN